MPRRTQTRVQPNYKYPSSLPLPSIFNFKKMPQTHIPTCNGHCVDFVDHARHLCCTVCHPPTTPSSPATLQSCQSHAELRAAVDRLLDAVRLLSDRVDALEEEVLGEYVEEL